MKKFLISFFIVVVSMTGLTAFSAEECFQLSHSKDTWSKTPETMCISNKADSNDYTVTLKSGLLFNEVVVATFNLNLIERVKCLDCNQDLYGILNPSNSVFNSLSIQFDGQRDIFTMKEEGTVSVGANKFYYRSY